jgi:hypothetical protein
MLHENFVILGAIIGFLGGVSYVIDTLKGKTKPNRVSWFIWALAPMLAFSAEISKGVGIHSLMTFMVGFSPLLIFIASFLNSNAEWKLTKLDLTCGVLSIIGLIIWLILKEGNIGIFFAILADGLAGIPTIVKSYKFPETENYIGFLTAAISAALTILTIKIWDFAHFGFPVYIFLICILLTILIKFKIGKLLNLQLSS